MELINYAHRGASGYAPENTFAAFYLGQQMGANGIETDVQRTRDGETTPLVYCGGARFLSLDPADPDAQGVRHEFLIRDGVAWGVRCGTRVFERMSV